MGKKASTGCRNLMIWSKLDIMQGGNWSKEKKKDDHEVCWVIESQLPRFISRQKQWIIELILGSCQLFLFNYNIRKMSACWCRVKPIELERREHNTCEQGLRSSRWNDVNHVRVLFKVERRNVGGRAEVCSPTEIWKRGTQIIECNSAERGGKWPFSF